MPLVSLALVVTPCRWLLVLLAISLFKGQAFILFIIATCASLCFCSQRYAQPNVTIAVKGKWKQYKPYVCCLSWRWTLSQVNIWPMNPLTFLVLDIIFYFGRNALLSAVLSVFWWMLSRCCQLTSLLWQRDRTRCALVVVRIVALISVTASISVGIDWDERQAVSWSAETQFAHA